MAQVKLINGFNVPAGSTTAIAAAQSLSAAGPLTLTTSTGVTLTPARRVVISDTGNDATLKYTITGLNKFGNAITEIVNGTSGSSNYSAYDYLTVLSIVSSGSTASNVSAGTNSIASTEWCEVDRNITPVNVSVYPMLYSGSATVTVEYTYDDPNGILSGITQLSGLPPNVLRMSGMSGLALTVLGGPNAQSGQTDAVFTQPIFAHRLTISAGTGTVNYYSLQAGLKQS